MILSQKPCFIIVNRHDVFFLHYNKTSEFPEVGPGDQEDQLNARERT